MTDTFVVVGGDAAGMSAASKAKRDAPDMDVVVFERGDWVSFGDPDPTRSARRHYSPVPTTNDSR